MAETTLTLDPAVVASLGAIGDLVKQLETDRAARAIIAEERARHVAKTAKLREIRLRREAAESKGDDARR